MVERACSKAGVTLVLAPGGQVDNDGNACSGYFDSENKVLAVAIEVNPFMGIGVLLHEYGHMQQWLESKAGRNTAGAKAWNEVSTYRVGSKRYAMAELRMELDAERRALRLLNKYKLGTKQDLETYTKTAALHILAHHVMHDKRKWFKRSVCLSNEVSKAWAMLPTTLRGSFLKPPVEPLYGFIASLLGK